MSPLKRAGKAAHEALSKANVVAYLDMPPETASEVARAVITAIREPDRPMIEAGGEQVLDTEVGAGQYASIADGRGSKLTADQQATNAWTAMIDAILAGDE